VIYPAAPENTFGAGQVGADSGFAARRARSLFAATARPSRLVQIKMGVINIWQAIFGVSICVGLVLGFIRQTPALAWGDTGHQVVALIARAHLTNPVRQKVDGMLAADRDPLTSGRPLTPHDMISAALWADRYRDNERSQPKPNSYTQTRDWHFVDIEIRQPNQQQACPQPGIPPGVAASGGPPNACVVDKIRQFNTELAAPGTDPQERIIALKFLLHFVGDVHQPLHSADDHDQGGNSKRVSARGFPAGNLHHFWDTEFVEQLGDNPEDIANELLRSITDAQRQAWSQGGPADWAQEAFLLARSDAYGRLPSPKNGTYRLSGRYIDTAISDVTIQLSRAGVRLAAVLNAALR